MEVEEAVAVAEEEGARQCPLRAAAGSGPGRTCTGQAAGRRGRSPRRRAATEAADTGAARRRRTRRVRGRGRRLERAATRGEVTGAAAGVAAWTPVADINGISLQDHRCVFMGRRMDALGKKMYNNIENE